MYTIHDLHKLHVHVCACYVYTMYMHVYCCSVFAGATPFSFATFGQGTGPILMTNLGCRGTEGFLVNCSFSTNTQFDTHAEDAGVRCVTSEMHVLY